MTKPVVKVEVKGSKTPPVKFKAKANDGDTDDQPQSGREAILARLAQRAKN